MNQLRSEAGRTITDLDRAAILLLSMGEENAAGIIKKLNRHEVKALSERMAKIANVVNIIPNPSLCIKLKNPP